MRMASPRGSDGALAPGSDAHRKGKQAAASDSRIENESKGGNEINAKIEQISKDLEDPSTDVQSKKDPVAVPPAETIPEVEDKATENSSDPISLSREQVEALKTLEGILNRISGLDAEGWFQRPVSDVEAPNYNAIIKQPMCFQVWWILF